MSSVEKRIGLYRFSKVMAKRENDLVATVPRLAGLPVIPNRQAGRLSHNSSLALTHVVRCDKTFEYCSNHLCRWRKTIKASFLAWRVMAFSEARAVLRESPLNHDPICTLCLWIGAEAARTKTEFYDLSEKLTAPPILPFPAAWEIAGSSKPV